MKKTLTASALAIAFATGAYAKCDYGGKSYSGGSLLKQEGTLMECSCDGGKCGWNRVNK